MEKQCTTFIQHTIVKTYFLPFSVSAFLFMLAKQAAKSEIQLGSFIAWNMESSLMAEYQQILDQMILSIHFSMKQDPVNMCQEQYLWI